jgi:hypothetical protein
MPSPHIYAFCLLGVRSRQLPACCLNRPTSGPSTCLQPALMASQAGWRHARLQHHLL